MIDYVGKKYGHLTVIGDAPDAGGRRKLICRCDCGNQTEVLAGNLVSGHTTSCGCAKKEIVKAGAHTIHGESKTRLYHIWKYMRKRCNNPNDSNYKKYGGRGISVCKEWQESWPCFRDWAIENGYDDGLSIDRVDNDGNYCPENCRWMDPCGQANNRRSSHYIDFDGANKTIAEWSHETGIPQAVLIGRVRLGWDSRKVLTEPYTPSKSSDSGERR